MSAVPAQLSLLSDPLSLARLQVLLIPVHHPDAHVGASVMAVDEGQPTPPPLTDEIYEQWRNLFRKVQSLRGDEIQHGPKTNLGHRRAATPSKDTPRNRFLPNSAGGSISRSANAANANHVHLAYPSQPPPKHLYPLSLLRMSAFPLIVIGVAVDDELTEGYSLGGNENASRRSSKPSNDNLWAQAFTQTLSAFLPPTAAFPLVKRIILVPSTPPILGSGQRSPVHASFAKGIHAIQTGEGVVRRAPMDGADAWVQKLLGEVVGQVFGELGELATALESANGLKTLSGTLLPSLSATLPHPSPISSSPTSMNRDDLRINTSPPAKSGKSPAPGLVHSTSLPIVPTATMGQHVARALTPGGRPTSVQAPSALPIPSTAIAQVPTATQSSNPFRRSAALIGRSASGTGPSPSLASSLMNSNSGSGKYTSASLSGIAGGRLLKLLGDMYLVTGSYADAIKCYEDGAERCRAVGDVLWEGLAREGRAVSGIGEAWEGRDGSNLSTPFNTSPIPVEILTHFLSALACLCRAPVPFPPTILSPAPQTPLAATGPGPSVTSRPTFAPPSAAGPNQMQSGEGLLAFLYSTLCLRISHFVLLTFAAGGWGSIALSSLITHSLPRSFPPLHDATQGRSRRSQLNQLAVQSQVSRGTVLGHAEAALGPFRRAMTKAEQLSILVEVVWIARWLEMERKEAAATRQVAKLLANVLAEGREESQRLVSKTDSAISTTFGSANEGVAIRRREMSEGNTGVMELLERVCTTFGIKLVDFEGEMSPTVTQAAKDVTEARFGWPEMQVEVMKEAIAVAEALPDHSSVIRLSVSALKGLHGYLSPGNQNYLAKLYPQAVNTIRRRAIQFDGIPWWLPGRIVLSVEVASLPPSRVPIEHAPAELAGNGQGRKDPFLYNPRLKAPEVGKTVLVANEQVDVFVTLQNVFSFDLEIQDLSLLTTGAPFITTPLPLILPASSVQTVRVTGQAPNAGSLQIRGVNVRLTDGSSAEFLLPVIDSAEQKRDSKRRSRVQTEVMKTKRQGLEARNSVILSEATDDTHRWLECTVVEEQPVLWIKKTSLSHGTIMLYNGEMSTIKITLENTSTVPVDFVKLSFEDSVSREAQHILAEGEVSPERAYELDNDSIQRPVFTWDNNTNLSIPPGGRAVINVQCLGKVGCTDALIRIDYGFVNRTTDAFHTRQLTFPVLFTVYHTLECYSLDLVGLRSDGKKQIANGNASENANGNGNGNGTAGQRLRSPTSGQFKKSADDELRSVLTNDEGNVLFCVNVRNVYSVPFEVALGTKSGPEDADPPSEDSPSNTEPRTVTRLVPPGATERLVLPIPRQSLPLETRTRPIPLPSGRQFTVDKTKKTPEEQARLRELFWFREKVLSMVTVSWREPGSLRSGHLSLADQYLSPSQLDSFRLDELNVVLSVAGREEPLAPTDFIDLRITVSNNLERSLRPYVRLEALRASSNGSSWSMPAPPPAPRRVSSLPANPMPVPKTVAFDGVLCTMMPTLAPGQSATHIIGAALLASGTYSFRAAAEEVVAVAPIQPPLVCFSPTLTVNVP